MAKVTMPLASFTASGRFGPLVYDKRLYVRRFVQPRQPKTTKQQKVRAAFIAANQSMKIIGATTRESMKNDFGPAWYATCVHAITLHILNNPLDAGQTLQYSELALSYGVKGATYQDESVSQAQAMYSLIGGLWYLFHPTEDAPNDENECRAFLDEIAN